MKGDTGVLGRRGARVERRREPRVHGVFPCAVLVLLVSLGAGSAPRLARAQSWLDDRANTEGPGFRVGNLELHPGLGVEGGYDTNPFLADQDATPTGVMRISGHLMASTLGVQRQQEGEGEHDVRQAHPMFAFRGGLGGAYYHYFAIPALSRVGADLHMNLTVNPQGRFRLGVVEEFTRTIKPFTHNTFPTSPNPPSYVRDRNIAGLELSAHSPGDTLVGLLNYQVDFSFFEGQPFRYANSLSHDLTQQLSWKIFPRTAFIQQAHVRFRSYPDSAGGASLLSDGVWLDARAGINGAVTQKLSMSVLAGYSAGFLQVADDFEGFNLRLETRYKPRPNIDLKLGYEHGFFPSYVGNYVESDRIDFSARLLGFGALLVGFRGLVSFDESGLAVDSTGMLLGNSPTRSDIRLHLSLFGEYRFTDWLGMNLTLSYAGDFTDYAYVDPSSGTSVIPDPGSAYQAVEIWLGVRVFY